MILKRFPAKRFFGALLATAALACATTSPQASHGEIAFPRPERETCAAGSRASYRLSVNVKDEQHAAIPGASVHLFPMGAGSETLVTARSNDNGIALAVVAHPGVYAVSVAVGGFEPQVRALTMRVGCSGSATFALKLGPVVTGK
jgi:hypothetical protein